ncbi:MULTISPECIES: DUF4276 family protein [unclassified Rhizobacter]|uniref:DUF4276 family protein n=1 Tax=unclassified Rhizobacter TaxID=2640088 RepID=UPI0006F406C3|nr:MULTISPECIES: DUF4276 family protein [unclassified Rhizobacter]KQU74830.1 cytoplasmic protein [Rhizobacter sp. Root29]KQW01095.1 cytoplasmic protein [Rhizobacter sp. Root1238]KRB03945.1 cytoplasmic protein [Rhizobacter sp. Root16D2]
MKGRIVFLLEEPSMKALLDCLLPRLFPGWVEGVHFQSVPHEGKSDLDRSIPRKLAAWRIPGDRFIVVRDNDNVDCKALKRQLRSLCTKSGRPDTLIRLVCQELESWYIGDIGALAKAFDLPRLDSASIRKRFALPDDWQKPSIEVKRLVPEFQKLRGARAMAEHLMPGQNRSHSFRVFLQGVLKVAGELGYVHPG